MWVQPKAEKQEDICGSGAVKLLEHFREQKTETKNKPRKRKIKLLMIDCRLSGFRFNAGLMNLNYF